MQPQPGFPQGLPWASRQVVLRATRQLRQKISEPFQARSEASTGFEPVMRVLQTLALPLGHDADRTAPAHGPFAHRQGPAAQICDFRPRHMIWELHEKLAAACAPLDLSGRWDSNPRPSPWQGDVLPLYYARRSFIVLAESAESQNRTDDTAIFSRVLYQLSYLGLGSRACRFYMD